MSNAPMTANRGESSSQKLSQRQLWIILGSLMLGTVLSALDGTIVTTALPTIVGKLGGLSLYAWVGTSYILTSTIATPILGKLGDLYGRRRIMLSTIVVFMVGSLLCGLAHDMPQLIAARGVQGLGGGGIQALTFAILGDLVSPRERGRYMGMYTGIYAGSAVLGPLVGGWMIESFAWQWIFLFNVPIAIFAMVAIRATLHVEFPRKQAKVDVVGAVLLSASLGCLIVSFEEARKGWSRPETLVLIAIAAVVFVAFVVQEQRTPEPIVPLRLFRNRIFTIASIMGFAVGTMSWGAQPFLSLQFQDANGLAPTRAGLYLSPVAFGVLFGSTYGGQLIARTGRYVFVPRVTLTLMLIGTIVISRISGSMPYAVLIVPMFFIGIGTGSTYTTTSIATQNAIDPADIGIGTAALTGLRSLGGSLALAAYGTLFNTVLGDQLPRRVPEGALPKGDVSRLLRSPAEIKALPDAVRKGVVDSVSAGTARVFTIAVPIVAVALLLAVILPELPLRTTRGLATAPAE